MEDEKPKKNTKRYPGMKKQPKFKKTGPKKKTYGPFSKEMKIKPGMSDYQKRTMKKFLEVKPGETLEQWRRRTAIRRVKDEAEISELSHKHPLKVLMRSRERNSIETKNRYFIVQPVEREFDFMRYYGIVCNYYAIKHNIRKEDLEVGFYFYTNIPFTRTRFENALVLMTGNNQGKLARFLREELIEEVKHKVINPRTKKVKYEKTDLFRLTKHFVDKLTYMYRTLGKMNGINLKRNPAASLPPELKQIIQDMNEEVQDILTGRKPQEPIKK